MVLTFGLNASMCFVMTARATRFPHFAVAQFPSCGPTFFINERLAFLAVFLHRED